MGWWLQGEWGLGTSWSPASGTHAGQEDGGPQDALSICGATLRRGFFVLAMEGEARGRHFQAVLSRTAQLLLTAGSHWAPDQRQSPARVGVGGRGGREPHNHEDEEEEG